MSIRLVRYLAQCGVASRRNAADLVRDGLVQVNGAVTTNVALGINPEDEVRLSGKLLHHAEKTTILILHKPAGVVTSRQDPHNDRNIFEFVPESLKNRLNPVGRLDKETTGLLILTDDGDLAFRLAHPRYGIEKTYRTIVEGRIDDEALDILEEGVMLDDGPTARAKIRLIDREQDRSEFEISIHEGRNRQVRRMCEAVGFRIKKLQRIGYGPISLGHLRRGETRLATEMEERALRNAVGLPNEQPSGAERQHRPSAKHRGPARGREQRPRPAARKKK